MRPSPLQLRGLHFLKVRVEPHGPEIDLEGGPNFDFDEMYFKIRLGANSAEGQEKEPTDYLVSLRFTIDNKKGIKKCPYLIDVEAIGFISLSETIETERRYNLVKVNGASLLFGAIREMVANVTSRSTKGMLLLPTANFQDHIEKQSGGKQQTPIDLSNPQAKPSRKVVRRPRRS